MVHNMEDSVETIGFVALNFVGGEELFDCQAVEDFVCGGDGCAKPVEELGGGEPSGWPRTPLDGRAYLRSD